jgi:putative salt-induced outer membrane protein YdiY
MEDIKTFSTDAPIEIALTDGSVIQQKAEVAAEGEIAVSSDGAAQPKTVAFTSIDKINPDKPHWKGAVVAGATLARGNTESSTANVNVEASRRGENDRITLGGGYFFANQRDNATRDTSTSSDNWFLKGKYDYFFSDQFYGYGNIKYEKDRIANLDKRVSPGIGLGYQWVERKDLSFFTEGGGSYVYERYTEPDETRTFVAARFAYQVEKSFNDYVSAFHNLEYLPSLERADVFLVNTDIGLRAKITERLLIEAKSQLAYNAKPSEGREKKDFRHILGVGWTF